MVASISVNTGTKNAFQSQTKSVQSKPAELMQQISAKQNASKAPNKFPSVKKINGEEYLKLQPGIYQNVKTGAIYTVNRNLVQKCIAKLRECVYGNSKQQQQVFDSILMEFALEHQFLSINREELLYLMVGHLVNNSVVVNKFGMFFLGENLDLAEAMLKTYTDIFGTVAKEGYILLARKYASFYFLTKDSKYEVKCKLAALDANVDSSQFLP